MSVIRRLYLAVVTLTLVTAATPAALAGEGLLRLSWDGCDPIVQNKDFLGGGSRQIATLVLSVSAFGLENNGHRSVLVIGPDVPDAWRFDNDGCQAGGLQVLHSGVSPACPAFQGGQPLGLNLFRHIPGPGNVELDIANTYDNFSPGVGQRYTMWQVRFDHTYSTAGAGDGSSSCGFASYALCFRIADDDTRAPEFLLSDGTKVSGGIERDWVTWQDPTNASNCPLIQAQESTWGRVKGMYR